MANCWGRQKMQWTWRRGDRTSWHVKAEISLAYGFLSPFLLDVVDITILQLKISIFASTVPSDTYSKGLCRVVKPLQTTRRIRCEPVTVYSIFSKLSIQLSNSYAIEMSSTCLNIQKIRKKCEYVYQHPFSKRRRHSVKLPWTCSESTSMNNIFQVGIMIKEFAQICPSSRCFNPSSSWLQMKPRCHTHMLRQATMSYAELATPTGP